MTMFSVHFKTRDFSAPLIFPAALRADRFSFSAAGGCDRATITATSTPENLLKMLDLLRCPVTIADPEGSLVWWGFVNSLTVYLENVQTTVTLDRVFNKVKITYSFISPDNKLADQLETAYSEVQASQNEYGIKEIVIHRLDLDEDFANNLRDTFLAAHAWPKSQLSQRNTSGSPHAVINCLGWFNTLGWQSYQNLEGFYANYGPGPGFLIFDKATTSRYPAQIFTPGAAGLLKYAYFLLRKIGTPARDLTARVISHPAGAVLATSAAFAGASLSDIYYTWVKFTFATPYSLVAGTTYKIGVTSPSVDASHHFAIRTDENQSFYQPHQGHYWQGSYYTRIPSITQPNGFPDLYFRAVCVKDTGEQLIEISSAANQHFSKITSISSGVLSSPYRDRGFNCLMEARLLMDLGTSNNRMILATVTEDLQLHFTEQPDPNQPTIYMDRFSKFHSLQGTAIKPYKPPVGQFAALSATDRFIMPFDRERLPLCFIQAAEYFPQSGKLKVKAI